jgi:glycosyltransferase involved in cell wall biosynthesis
VKNLAIVADWLPTYGGAEHVVSTLSTLWPDAPIFTTIANCDQLGPLAKAPIRTNRFLQLIYRILGKHQWLLPWMPQAVEQIDLSGFSVVLSSSHAVAKGVIPSSTAVHVCYCHTPMRYAWEMEAEYLRDFRIRFPMKKYVNSTETECRIHRIYGRKSIVISPPVSERFFSEPMRDSGSYFLAIGRLVPYKRFDLLIDLANRLSLPLKIAGTGSELTRLRSLAGPTVEFTGFAREDDLPALYGGAAALLFPQIEDAGIVPMEAQASGTPVIGLRHGGLSDVIIDGKTGVLVADQTVEAFMEAISRFKSMTFDRSRIREHARQFHEDVFSHRIRETVEAAARDFSIR